MKPFIIVVHVIKIIDGKAKCLLLRRCGKFLPGNWQMVAGKVHDGELTTVGALRELYEETGLRPDRFYTADYLESFFLEKFDIICHSPVFVAFLDKEHNVTLSPHEHDEFKWLTIPEALSLLEFSGQRAALMHIEEQFIKKAPNNRFLLNLKDYA